MGNIFWPFLVFTIISFSFLKAFCSLEVWSPLRVDFRLSSIKFFCLDAISLLSLATYQPLTTT